MSDLSIKYSKEIDNLFNRFNFSNEPELDVVLSKETSYYSDLLKSDSFISLLDTYYDELTTKLYELKDDSSRKAFLFKEVSDRLQLLYPIPINFITKCNNVIELNTPFGIVQNSAKDPIQERDLSKFRAVEKILLIYKNICAMFNFDYEDLIRRVYLNLGYEQRGKESEKVQVEKIKWMGSVEQFGYLVGEMIAKGYIELPTYETEGRISKLAELLYQYFEIPARKGKNKGEQTTLRNLVRALNPNSNSLNEKAKSSFKLPPRKDLE